MARPLRIAVLECDTPMPAVLASRGTYGNIIGNLLRSGFAGLDASEQVVAPEYTGWDVVDKQEYPQIEDIDVLVMSGSKHTAWKDDPWILKLVDYVKLYYTTTKKPLVGICFGHQIIGRALGGKVGLSSSGWEVSVDTIQLNGTGREVLGMSSLKLHQMHRDAVLSVPEGLQNMGSSPSCEIQGLYEPGRVFALQAHPEFTGDIMGVILQTRHDQKVFDDSLYQDAMSRKDNAHDGLAVSRAIWHFLLSRPSDT